MVNSVDTGFGPAPVVRSTGSGGEAPFEIGLPEIIMRKRCQRLVRAEGLEPPQLSSLEPKSSASTSSATPAYEHHIRPRCRGRRLYNMRPRLRSKKMAGSARLEAAPFRIAPEQTVSRNNRGCWTARAENGPHRRRSIGF